MLIKLDDLPNFRDEYNTYLTDFNHFHPSQEQAASELVFVNWRFPHFENLKAGILFFKTRISWATWSQFFKVAWLDANSQK